GRDRFAAMARERGCGRQPSRRARCEPAAEAGGRRRPAADPDGPRRRPRVAVRRPQRLSTRLTLWLGALFVATIGVIVGLTLFFANRAFESSVDDQLIGIAEEAQQRMAA